MKTFAPTPLSISFGTTLALMCGILFAGGEAPASPIFTKPLAILIDPGHGGVDTGATFGKAKESDIALQIALALSERLSHDSKFKPSLTRQKDQSRTLTERTRLAEETKADLLISINANSSPDPRAKGAEFFFQNQLASDEDSLFLAANENKNEKILEKQVDFSEVKKESDLQSIVEDLKRQHRLYESHRLARVFAKIWALEQKDKPGVVRQAPFHVVSQAGRPSVLIEVGFLSNKEEADRLRKPQTQSDIAEKIHHAVIEYAQALNSGGARLPEQKIQ